MDWEDFFRHIEHGGTVHSFVTENNLIGRAIIKDIRADKNLSNRYALAKQVRSEAVKDKLLSAVLNIVEFDPGCLVNESGGPMPLKAISRENRKCIEGLKINEISGPDGIGTVTRDFKFSNRLKAIELLGREFGMFIKRVEHSGQLTLEDLVQASYKSKTEK